MRLHLRNIGMIKEADIDTNGLTVITGENDTGKSTIGKVLYSIYYALNDCIYSINEYKLLSVQKDIYAIVRMLTEYNIAIPQEFTAVKYFDIDILTGYLKLDKFSVMFTEFVEFLNGLKELSAENRNEIDKHVNSVREKIELGPDNHEFRKYVLNLILNAEFSGQVNNVLRKVKE